MSQNKHKRILMVGSARESGGGVSSVIRLMEQMPLFSSDGGYEMYWLGTQIQRNYLWKMWYALKSAFVAFFIMWRYDIVHFHAVPDRIGLLIQMPELLLAKLWRKKVILHIHMGNQLRRHTKNGLFLWCLKKADVIVLLAEKWKALFEEEYDPRFTSKRIRTAVVYNAVNINPSPLTPHPSSFNEREKSIIMAGYFDENKAPDILMRAWTKLKAEYPDWRITLMGNGDVEKYKAICHELSLDDVVSFPGYVTGKAKKEIWSKASIFCLCSHEEGFPMVVLEAWNCGIPVITTPVGGLPDVIEEGKNCLTFNFDDVEALAKQLRRLMDNEALRQNMSKYEQQFVREHFSLNEVSGELERLYSSL